MPLWVGECLGILFAAPGNDFFGCSFQILKPLFVVSEQGSKKATWIFDLVIPYSNYTFLIPGVLLKPLEHSSSELRPSLILFSNSYLNGRKEGNMHKNKQVLWMTNDLKMKKAYQIS